MHARKPASFWRENVLAVVTLLRVEISNVRSFIILRSGEGATSFTKGNSASFSSENGKMKFSGESII